MLEPGRVCVKFTGRDAGERVVVVESVDDVFVIVVDRRGKRHKVNRRHLTPLREKIEVSGLSDEDIAKNLEA